MYLTKLGENDIDSMIIPIEIIDQSVKLIQLC